MSGFEISLALGGQLEEWKQGVTYGTLVALRAAVEDAADEGLGDLRRDLQDGLPNLSPKTWRKIVFPKNKSKLTYKPTAILYSKADAIVTAFDEGGEISADGKLMAVPLPYFQQRMPKRRNGSSKSKVQIAYEMFGEENLEIIPANGDRPAMIVLMSGGISKSGRISHRARTKTGKRRKNTGMIPLFFLVESVTLQKRLNVQDIFNNIERRFPQHLLRALNITLADF